MAQANITLSALTGDTSFLQRIVSLNPDRLTIPIGRASKSISKGILGASDNAWFDSPVMSREHAEVCLNSTVKIVTICDLGSMHGTFLNDERLPPNQPTQLNDRDIIIFGAEVRRGPEVFPACSFRVNIGWSPYQTVRTFSVPNSSDIEEEEGYGFSDPIVEEHGQTSSEDDVSLEIPQPIKAYHAFTAIDLTRDDSPIPTSSGRMDLTGDTPVELVDEGHMESKPARPVLDYSADLINGSVHSRNLSIPVNVISGGGLLSSDSDDEPYELPDPTSENTDGSDNSEASDELGGHEYPELDEESTPEARDEDEDSIFKIQNEDHDLMTQHSTTICHVQQESENIMDADDNSDFSLSKAGAEGLRVLFEDVPQQSATESLESAPSTKAPAEVDHQISGSLYSSPEGKDFSITSGSIEVISEAPSTIPPFCSVSEQVDEIWSMKEVMIGNIHNERSVGARQPSPSDAAMVKAASQQRLEKATNETPAYHFQGQEFSQPSPTLGEKTGKHAFFEAREKNKAKFFPLADMKDAGDLESSALSQPALVSNKSLPKEEPQLDKLQYCRFDGKSWPSQPKHHSKLIGNRQREVSLSFQAAGMPSNLCLQLPPLVDRPPSPEYDMTSAVKYNESKAKSAARCNLSIHDIIEKPSWDQSTREPGPKTGGKRKACDISEILTDEVRAWASSQDTTKSLDKNSNGSSKVTLPLADMDANFIRDERPAKRLKTLLERAAFAAVGGVAVGAGLFLGLVVTAPNFS